MYESCEKSVRESLLTIEHGGEVVRRGAVDVRTVEPNCNSHGRSWLKRDLRNPFRLCVHFKSHLNAGASRPIHTRPHTYVRTYVTHTYM